MSIWQQVRAIGILTLKWISFCIYCSDTGNLYLVTPYAHRKVKVMLDILVGCDVIESEAKNMISEVID